MCAGSLVPQVLVSVPALEVLARAVDSSKAGNFTILVQALELTGLNETLAAAEGYTLLAPNDAAFESLAKVGECSVVVAVMVYSVVVVIVAFLLFVRLQANGIPTHKILDASFLSDILLMHVVLSGEVLAEDLVSGTKFTTAGNETIQVKIGEEGEGGGAMPRAQR